MRLTFTASRCDLGGPVPEFPSPFPKRRYPGGGAILRGPGRDSAWRASSEPDGCQDRGTSNSPLWCDLTAFHDQMGPGSDTGSSRRRADLCNAPWVDHFWGSREYLVTTLRVAGGPPDALRPGVSRSIWLTKSCAFPTRSAATPATTQKHRNGGQGGQARCEAETLQLPRLKTTTLGSRGLPIDVAAPKDEPKRGMDKAPRSPSTPPKRGPLAGEGLCAPLGVSLRRASGIWKCRRRRPQQAVRGTGPSGLRSGRLSVMRPPDLAERDVLGPMFSEYGGFPMRRSFGRACRAGEEWKKELLLLYCPQGQIDRQGVGTRKWRPIHAMFHPLS